MSAAIDIRDGSLGDIAPASILSDPEIAAMNAALDPELREVAALVVEAIVLPRIADLSEDLCDAIAWGFRFNELLLWDTSTLEGKRALLQNALAIRRTSGTVYAVLRIFDLLTVTGHIVEWFQDSPPAAAYTYRIRLVSTHAGITLAELLQIPELTLRFAPARCQMSELAVESDSSGALWVSGVPCLGGITTIPFGP